MNYRRLMLVAGLTSAVAASFGLDFETPGETIQSLFPKLSKETGLTLRFNANVANEVVIIKAKNVDGVTLLKKISDATGLTWTQEEGAYRLGRSFLDDQKAATEYQNYTVTAWKNWQADPTVNRASQVDGIMQVFLPEYISNMTIGGRLVFADKPNRNQSAMSGEVRSLATQILREQQQQRIDQLEQRYLQRPSEQFRQIIDAQKAPPSKILLIIRRQSLNTFSVVLQGLGANGNPMYSTNGVYTVTAPSPDTSGLQGWNLPEGSPERANLKLLTSSSTNSNGSSQGIIREAILDPVNNEPFAIAIGPALLASAPESQNFVACLPDESFDRIASGLDSQGPLGLSGTGVTAKKDEDGWVIVTPQLRVHNWDTRRDRQAIIPLIQKLSTSGILSLNDQADYAKSVSTWFSTNSWEFNLARKALGAAASRELGRITGSQIEGLAIYNGLRDQLKGQDVTLPITSLKREFITFTVFNSPSDPRVAPVQNGARQTQNGASEIAINLVVTDLFAQQRGGNFSVAQIGRSSERTELYVGGLPTTGHINVDYRGRDAFVVRSSDGNSQSVMSENDLTRFRASQLSSNIRTRDGGLSATNNVFGSTNSTTITFNIMFSDGTMFSRSVSGTEAPTNFVSYDRLPQSLLTQIEKDAVEMASRANQQQGRGGNRRGSGQRGGPPPPQ